MVGKKQKHHSLYGQLISPGLLTTAFYLVEKNRGSYGVDKESIEQFGATLEENILSLSKELKEKKYQPLPVRRVFIPKRATSKEKRPLGIPAVRDRVVQQALRLIIEPIFEAKFLDCSYGFRPGKSAHMALEQVQKYLESGYEWVIDADIQKYFDTIPHKKLIDQVAEEISDGSVLKLIRSMLTSGVLQEGEIKATTTGTPQGGVISPLLANLYLHHFDTVMAKRGHKLVRWADDWVILCKSKRAAERVMEGAKKILEGDLELKVHPEKSRIVHISEGFVFLGYVFYPGGRRPSSKAIKGLKDKIRKITRRNQTVGPRYLIEQLNAVVRGWGNYFCRMHGQKKFEDIDAWIRRRVRMVIMRSWRSYKKLHETLKAKGWDTGNLKKISMSRWRNSKSPLIHAALDNKWFKQYGLLTLEAIYRKFLSMRRCLEEPCAMARMHGSVRGAV